MAEVESPVDEGRVFEPLPFLRPMTMKFCPNYRCVAYRRLVYTQSTRCAFCRWDLKPPRLKSETAIEPKASGENSDPQVIAPTVTLVDSRAKQKRTFLRPSA
jgi:hypothetical protein